MTSVNSQDNSAVGRASIDVPGNKVRLKRDSRLEACPGSLIAIKWEN